MTFKMPPVWPEGPRDWSPRLSKALRKADVLRTLIPSELIVEVDPNGSREITGNPRKLGRLIVNGTSANLSETYAHIPGVLGKVAFLVMLDKPEARALEGLSMVWILSNGHLAMGRGIVSLLEGKIPGYEHLAGQWPFEGSSEVEIV